MPSLNVAPITIPVAATSTHRQQYGSSVLDTMLSPVTQNGSFEFDRIIKAGPILKRTRKTKKWKPIYIVLRPNQLSIYRDKQESKLRHQINLAELTAVARQKDPKRKSNAVFGLFSPSRNYHLEAASEQEAQSWVEVIRSNARMDDLEEEMYLASPGGGEEHTYHGFGRSIDAQLSSSAAQPGGIGDYSSSDVETPAIGSSYPPPARPRDRNNTTTSTTNPRRLSTAEYSGVDHGSFSDFSDSALPTARMSALSLAYTDGRPSTSSTRPPQSSYIGGSSVYGGQTPLHRPSIGARNPSQLSNLALNLDTTIKQTQPSSTIKTPVDDSERVVYHGWLNLLKSKSGVRQWKRVWMVLRPKSLALYKNEEEYSALLILPFPTIIDVVEIDPISRSKTACMQVLSEEKNYRFCAMDEESLTKWLGAFKSLLAKRKAVGVAPGTSAPAAIMSPPAAVTTATA